jgi:hypothetical protein
MPFVWTFFLTIIFPEFIIFPWVYCPHVGRKSWSCAGLPCRSLSLFNDVPPEAHRPGMYQLGVGGERVPLREFSEMGVSTYVQLPGEERSVLQILAFGVQPWQKREDWS